MKYELVVGLEVHSQLLTNSKMFCGCNATYQDSEPNTHTCPVCLGLPGALPVINKEAVEYTIRVGLALNCEIARVTKWDRKNYHYPDLPKGYQISQYDMPLCRNGWLVIETEELGKRRIGIRRVHLEEDTGRSVHAEGRTLLDYNRSGVPLIEIVTEPDIRSPEEARQFLQKLRSIIRYIGVGSGDLEAGAMRLEPNVSVRSVGSSKLGIPVEVKNLNSFRAVKLALEYEQQRQGILLTRGAPIDRETRGWVEARGETVPQRRKEEAEDYRYFPEPDLPSLRISEEWIEEIRAGMPELPRAKVERFQEVYGLSAYDADVLTAERETAEWFEEAVRLAKEKEIAPKAVSNWVTGELFRISSAQGKSITELPITQSELIELIELVEQDKISQNVGKSVLDKMIESGRSARQIVEEEGLTQISDEAQLEAIVGEVLENHPEEVQKFLDGKSAVAGYLMGQVMKGTRGKANPQVARSLILTKLEAMKGDE
ncbi:MAG: Asp-tRNA(Asn)/Glu-tRNA(Gln) amidotransferase subunit GatB [Chloroflexota bacterium]|nr:Asp-tRNA(Asn)/Glu-tRNA(Gln) amidotransferase subunit GatB [Chloroflexota bacterium]